MNPQTLYDKLWSNHLVREDGKGTALIYIDRHLVHEVTSPQAFEGLKLAGRRPWRIDSIVATADHNTPTQHWDKGILDPIVEFLRPLPPLPRRWPLQEQPQPVVRQSMP